MINISWNLSPYLAYTPGYDIGCTIWVANFTDSPKECSLVARITEDSTLVSEETLLVSGETWFSVGPGVTLELPGKMSFSNTNVDLVLLLVDRESEEVLDSLTARLVSPVAIWPLSGPTTVELLIGSMIGIVLLGMVGAATRGLLKSPEKKEVA